MPRCNGPQGVEKISLYTWRGLLHNQARLLTGIAGFVPWSKTDQTPCSLARSCRNCLINKNQVMDTSATDMAATSVTKVRPYVASAEISPVCRKHLIKRARIVSLITSRDSCVFGRTSRHEIGDKHRHGDDRSNLCMVSSSPILPQASGESRHMTYHETDFSSCLINYSVRWKGAKVK